MRILIDLIFRILGVGCLIFSVYYGISHHPEQVRMGVIHLPSLGFVGMGLLGITLASYQAEVVLGMLKNFILLSPSRLRDKFLEMEEMLPALTETYYEKGAAFFLEEIERRKLKGLWHFIASKLESRIPIHDIQMMIQNEGRAINEKLFIQIRVMQGLATIAPAVGMTGTILGLIKLLKNLQQFDALGSNMALAFITALYGLIFGNFIFIPVVNRLNSAREESMQILGQSLNWLNTIAHRKPAIYLDRGETKKIVS